MTVTVSVQKFRAQRVEGEAEIYSRPVNLGKMLRPSAGSNRSSGFIVGTFAGFSRPSKTNTSGW
jgi:hypothetical protein